MLETNLLATKLHRPNLPGRWIHRPHLSRRLDDGLSLGRPMTLVSAPAGFGKTSCISEWINRLRDVPVAWLSLDLADDDPGIFFAYLVAALQQVDGRLCRELGGVLRAGQLPPVETISATLINDVVRLRARCLLVLDDFHVIQDRFILQVLETLVTNLPQGLHLALVTREDPPLPLARLRANNQLTEIRARDLRFSGADIDRFLRDVMELSLSPDDVVALEVKTEGWIAGLQLAALSAREQTDPSAFIANLSGSHRYVLGYLTEEVLNRQPPEIRQFLLQTAILDRLNGDLCNAVTGRSDSQHLLENLHRANLFIIALDDEGRWYRYHHLFADLLRDLAAVQNDELAALHQRASQWFASQAKEPHGDQASAIRQAMHHALAAADYQLATELLEQHATSMVMQGYAKTLNSWVQSMPDDYQQLSPRTELAFAWMHLLRGAYASAQPYLQRVQQILDDSQVQPLTPQNRAALEAEWLVMNALLSLMAGAISQGSAFANEALAVAPDGDLRVRSLAYWAVGSVSQTKMDYDSAAETYQRAIQHAREANSAVVELMAISGLAQMALEQGKLHWSFEIASQAVSRIERSGILPPITAVAYGALAQIHYEWFELDMARQQMQRAFELSTLGGYNSGIAFSHVFFARLHQLKGSYDNAASAIQQAVQRLQAQTPTYIRQEILAQQVRLYLADDRLDSAQTILEAEGFTIDHRIVFPVLFESETITHSQGLLYNAALHLILANGEATGDPSSLAPAIAVTDRLIALARHSHTGLVALESHLLRACLHTALGNLAAGEEDYVAALRLGHPQGIVGTFLEHGAPVVNALRELYQRGGLEPALGSHVDRIVQAFDRLHPDLKPLSVRSNPSSNLVPPVEPLTEREREVLQLIAAGRKYKEIASELFISLNTVRYHVKGIYSKLQVSNRTQAVRIARLHHLL